MFTIVTNLVLRPLLERVSLPFLLEKEIKRLLSFLEVFPSVKKSSREVLNLG